MVVVPTSVYRFHVSGLCRLAVHLPENAGLAKCTDRERTLPSGVRPYNRDCGGFNPTVSRMRPPHAKGDIAYAVPNTIATLRF